MSEAALDQLVLSYLEKRRYQQAHRVFQEEVKGSNLDMAFAPKLSSDTGIVESLIFYLVADKDTTQYIVAYDQLTAWVDHSLDLYQAELARILYPVFIHCYLQLIEKGANDEAAQLMSKHVKRFSEAPGVNPRTRMQELNELQTVAAPEHLKTHRIAQTVRTNRFPVRLCAYSFDLLTTFLTSAKPLALMLGIINEHLKVQVVDGAPSGLDQEEPEALELLSGHLPEDTVAVNQGPLRLSLLQTSVEVSGAKQTAEAAEEQAKASEGKKKGKRAREAEEKGCKEAADKAAQLVGADAAPEVPLLSMPARLEAAWMDDIKHRAGLRPDALPSAIFFTFLNTSHSLNCISFAADATLVAAGFADASIRMHNLAEPGPAGIASAGAPALGTSFLRGHTGAVFGTDITLDRRLLLSASADGTVRMWSTELAANLSVYRNFELA